MESNKYRTTFANLARETVETCLALFKITLPVIAITKILEELGFIEHLSVLLAPLMNLVGLPGEMGLVWATGMTTSLYGGMAVFAALAPQLDLNVAQVTIICAMLLIAHSLPVELSVSKKAGAPLLPIAVLRFGGAICYGFLLLHITTAAGVWQQKAEFLFVSAKTEQTLLQWFWAQGVNIGMISVVICAIVFMMHLLRIAGILQWLEKVLSPLLPHFGMSHRAAPLTVVGMVMGIGYGGALIIRESTTGKLSRSEIFHSMVLMGLCHSLIEDTLCMVALGGKLTGIFWGRMVFALAVTYFIANFFPGKKAADREKHAGRYMMDKKKSDFGKKFTSQAGILSLMDDLGSAVASAGDDLIMMGGGNPGYVPEFQELMRAYLAQIAADPQKFAKLTAQYDPPQGKPDFLQELACLFKDEFGWPLSEDNICLTNGSQSGFFMLFNLLGGRCGSKKKRIHLPLAPEYIGYADLGIEDGLFTTTRPKIEYIGDDMFKYRVDFENINVTDDIGAFCVSRPTNPTGNVITDSEVDQLDQLAREHGVPFILDNAYGVPFPGITFIDAAPKWNENMVCCMSLSKLGLPAVRTGIIIAGKEIARALASMNAIMALSPGSFGAVLCHDLIKERQIIDISKKHIQPFYQRKVEHAVACIRSEFGSTPYRIHKPEGAIFLWLWFEDLPISSLELYERLKRRGVLVISGHFFFPGMEEEWQHKHECIRVNYSQDSVVVERGVAIIAEEVKKAYEGK